MRARIEKHGGKYIVLADMGIGWAAEAGLGGVLMFGSRKEAEAYCAKVGLEPKKNSRSPKKSRG